MEMKKKERYGLWLEAMEKRWQDGPEKRVKNILLILNREKRRGGALGISMYMEAKPEQWWERGSERKEREERIPLIAG